MPVGGFRGQARFRPIRGRRGDLPGDCGRCRLGSRRANREKTAAIPSHQPAPEQLTSPIRAAEHLPGNLCRSPFLGRERLPVGQAVPSATVVRRIRAILSDRCVRRAAGEDASRGSAAGARVSSGTDGAKRPQLPKSDLLLRGDRLPIRAGAGGDYATIRFAGVNAAGARRIANLRPVRMARPTPGVALAHPGSNPAERGVFNGSRSFGAELNPISSGDIKNIHRTGPGET